VDEARVVQAILDAERRSSGQIRVSVAPLFWGRVDRAAEKAFRRLHMDATRDHNGVLFFVVPSRKRFTVLGDAGIHGKVAEAFWKEVAACLSAHFREQDFTGGLVEGIGMVGQQLADHFPRREDASGNELPDEVDFDG
jgi:uncharacterized membrane protein